MIRLDVDAVGFDFDHTLGVDHRLERTVAAELLGSGHERAIDLALASYRYGARSIDDAVAAIGLEPAAFRTAVLERASALVEPLAGVRELLDDLRSRGIRVAILSNGWSPLQETKAQLVGFDGPVLVSDLLGVRKPSEVAFAALVAAFGSEARRCAYVGDDPVCDVLGALSAGMQAVWLDAEGRSYPQDIGAPTARVASLEEARTLFQGPPP